MDAVFINKNLSENEIAFISKFSRSSLMIYYTNELPQQLTHFKSEKLSTDISVLKKLNYEIFNEILEFGNIFIKEIKINDYLSYHNFNIIPYHKFRLFYYLKNLNYEIQYLNLIPKNKYNKVFLFGTGKKSDYPEIQNFIFPDLKQRNKTNINFIFKLFLLFVIRTYLGFFQNKKTKKHLINYIYAEYPIIDPVSLKEKKGNIFEYLKKNTDNDFVYFSDAFIENLKKPHFKLEKKYFLRKGNIFFESILFKSVFNFSVLKRYNKLRKSLYSKLFDIKQQELSTNQKILLKELKCLKSSTDFYLLRYIAAENFFKKNKFKIKTISSFDENSPNNKTILDAAKFNNIKTFGIQHGAIHDIHPAYIYSDKDDTVKILPDYTLLWGLKWKDIIVKKGNYPEKSVYITGNLRTDIIPLLKKTEVNRKNKTILFATQPQPDKNMRYQNAFDVFNVLKKFPKIKLIVKPHPNEKDITYYEEIIRKTGITNYEINTKNDLYLLINLSDAVIVSYSTVGLEALFFKKPLIVLDYLKQDILGYIADGVGFEVNNSDDLYKVINLLNQNKLKVNEQAIDNFVSQRVYKIDGNSGKRIVEFIKTASSK